MAIPTFPALPGLTYPVKRAPIMSTLKQDSWSGKSTPLQLWSYPRRRFTVAFDFLRSDAAHLEQQQLEGFFLAVGGSAGLFAFADPDDGTAASAPFGTGDGATTTFQLARTRGGFSEPVFYPSPGFTVASAGTATAAFAIGANPGQIVFASAPPNGAALTWSGSFAWLCRFDDDSIGFDKFMNALYTLDGLSFTSVKL